MYQIFNIETWKRKDAYNFFRTYDDPAFNLCSYIDTTNLYKFCKAEKHSFSLSMLYFSLQVANEMEEFKLRILDEKVIVFDKINCGSTIFNEDETFSFCYFDLTDSLREFEETGKQNIETQLKSKSFEPKINELDLIHYSVIPWTAFSSIKHSRKFAQPNSIPKIAFGKYFTENHVMKMPISIEVNHALMDGFHVGKYLDTLQNRINELI